MGLFLTIVALVLAAIEGGCRPGSFRHRYAGREKEAPVGAMVGATLGLLAFMLAFTFGMAASRAMGYHAGLVGTIRSVTIIVVAVTFSAVIALIADLDRPAEGNPIVSQPLSMCGQSMNPTER